MLMFPFKNLNKVLSFAFFVFITFFGLFGFLSKLATPALADDEIFGVIEPPPGVQYYQYHVSDDGTNNKIGILIFVSNIIKLVVIVAGIWTMLNFIFAGWIYITNSGDSAAGQKVSAKMTNSVIGLLIVSLSYTIAAIIGMLVFGDASYIINPKLASIVPGADDQVFGNDGILPPTNSSYTNIGTGADSKLNPIANLVKFLSNLIGVLTILAGLFFIVYFVMGAFGWVTAAGDSGKVEKARNKMVQGFLGLVVIVISYSLIGIIGKVIGVDLINLETTIRTVLPN